MLYFALVFLMLKCSTLTGTNIHLLQEQIYACFRKRVAEAFYFCFTQYRIQSGLVWSCALL